MEPQLRPGPFTERLWSPSLYSYLLKQAGVPNLIQLPLHQPIFASLNECYRFHSSKSVGLVNLAQ